MSGFEDEFWVGGDPELEDDRESLADIRDMRLEERLISICDNSRMALKFWARDEIESIRGTIGKIEKWSAVLPVTEERYLYIKQRLADIDDNEIDLAVKQSENGEAQVRDGILTNYDDSIDAFYFLQEGLLRLHMICRELMRLRKELDSVAAAVKKLTHKSED